MTRPDLIDPTTCEVDDCDHPRGAALRSIRSYGCVLCVWHEDLYQQGEIDLPDSRSDKRQAVAEDILLS
jgi:hypothetical protein